MNGARRPRFLRASKKHRSPLEPEQLQIHLDNCIHGLHVSSVWGLLARKVIDMVKPAALFHIAVAPLARDTRGRNATGQTTPPKAKDSLFGSSMR